MILSASTHTDSWQRILIATSQFQMYNIIYRKNICISPILTLNDLDKKIQQHHNYIFSVFYRRFNDPSKNSFSFSTNSCENDSFLHHYGHAEMCSMDGWMDGEENNYFIHLPID